MAVIALASASGSPGVTTTAVGLTLLWPRPAILVEADPSGSSGILAGYFRGTREYDAGLVEVALSALDVGEALRTVVRPLNGDASLIAGVRSPSQAAALRDVWAPLTDALADLESHGQDVIVDAGRLGLTGSAEPLLAAADATVLLTRTTLPALAAARPRAETIVRNREWTHPATVLIGEGQPYRSHEVARALHLPVIASITDEPAAAGVFHRGEDPPRGFNTGPYVRSLQATNASIQALVDRNRAALEAGVAG